MANSNESIADVLAEMRADEIETEDGVIRLDGYADRIEAAAERERDEDRQLAAIAESDEAFARCARCDRPERATGNAAAMREALENAISVFRDDLPTPRDISRAFAAANAALSSPARNCDRYATAKDALDAFIREKEIKSADVDNMNLRDFFDWLFAPAEGGAE